MIADGHEDLALLMDKAMKDVRWSACQFDILSDDTGSYRYFSVRAWSNLHDITLTRTQAIQLGKAATKEHKLRSVFIFTVGGKDEGSLPLVSMYNEDILDLEASKLCLLV